MKFQKSGNRKRKTNKETKGKRKYRTPSRWAAFLLFFALFFAVGCGSPAHSSDSSATAYSLDQMAAAILREQKDLPALYALRRGEEDFPAYAERCLGSELAAEVEDGIFCVPADASASELCLFRMKDEDAVGRAEEALAAYADRQAALFTGYAPREAALAENAVTAGKGRYTALFICADPTGAKETFLACFDSDPPAGLALTLPSLPSASRSEDAVSENDGADLPSDASSSEETAKEVYDHDAILAAYRTGDESGLGPRGTALLARCREILGEIIREDMTPYEKELAVHDWMILHGTYDEAVLNPMAGIPETPDHDNPFGFVLSGRGICLGYTSTFQLFMDLLGIECISVKGYARVTEDHAWNEVKLDGEWYCVDVTWDDPTGAGDRLSADFTHRYFNVTSDFLRETDHQWNENGVPEAVGMKYAWIRRADEI